MIQTTDKQESAIPTDAANLLKLYHITSDDLDRVRQYGEIIMPKIQDYAKIFYAWLETQPVFEQFFSEPAQLARVKNSQVEYWNVFFSGEVDNAYLQQRIVVGETHARIGLPLQDYLPAMNYSLSIFLDDLYDGSLTDAEFSAIKTSVTKLVHLDTDIVVSTYSEMVNELIAEQSQAIMKMSTPVTTIWEGVLFLPLVGIVDSKRAQNIMDSILIGISESQSQFFILDISGVAIVDTAVADRIIKITKATRLMGCECILSGVSPGIAQTMVELGIDLGTIYSTTMMREALSIALQKIGVRIVSGHKGTP